MSVPIDTLVRGLKGKTEQVTEARVYRSFSSGWIAGIDGDGKQVIIYEPEVIGDPRPVYARRDIPARFR